MAQGRVQWLALLVTNADELWCNTQHPIRINVLSRGTDSVGKTRDGDDLTKYFLTGAKLQKHAPNDTYAWLAVLIGTFLSPCPTCTKTIFMTTITLRGVWVVRIISTSHDPRAALISMSELITLLSEIHLIHATSRGLKPT